MQSLFWHPSFHTIFQALLSSVDLSKKKKYYQYSNNYEILNNTLWNAARLLQHHAYFLLLWLGFGAKNCPYGLIEDSFKTLLCQSRAFKVLDSPYLPCHGKTLNVIGAHLNHCLKGRASCWTINPRAIKVSPAGRLSARVSCPLICRWSLCPLLDPVSCRPERSESTGNGGSPRGTTAIATRTFLTMTTNVRGNASHSLWLEHSQMMQD